MENEIIPIKNEPPTEQNINPASEKQEGTETKLLKVLSNEEKIARSVTVKRGESTVKRMAIVTTRLFKLNLDVLIFLTTLFIFFSIGYTYARIFGLSPEDIKREAKDYLELFIYLLLGIITSVFKMAMNPGALSKHLNERWQQIKGDINKEPEVIGWNGLTINNTENKKE